MPDLLAATSLYLASLTHVPCCLSSLSRALSSIRAGPYSGNRSTSTPPHDSLTPYAGSSRTMYGVAASPHAAGRNRATADRSVAGQCECDGEYGSLAPGGGPMCRGTRLRTGQWLGSVNVTENTGR